MNDHSRRHIATAVAFTILGLVFFIMLGVTHNNNTMVKLAKIEKGCKK